MSDFEDQGYVATPDDFQDVHFARNNLAAFTAYVDLKIQGYASGHCLRHVFGSAYIQDGQHGERIYAMERNPEYQRLFKQRLNSIKASELWSPQVSINELLQMVRSPFVKDAARLAAIKELNIMYNITVTDDKGVTKPGRSLDDFYAKEAGERSVPGGEATGGADPQPTTH